MSKSEHDPGLVVLSLDGGGVRGLSSLLILKECMTRLQHQLGLAKRPEPFEHFDIVGGTGTGGISAAMLGRLRIPLDRAIEKFAKLAADVFSERKYISASGSGAFKSTKMQQALKTIIRGATGDESERLMDSQSNDKCKTVVFAMSKQNMNAGLPRAFRSYQSLVNQMPDCAIWEAMCATTAHPDLFKSIDIGDGLIKESFIDGGLGCSNPLAHILTEVKLLYPDRRIGCIISIGAGHARTIHIPSFSPFQRLLPTNAIEAMKAIATDSEQEAQRMAVRFSGTQDVYFRLNVDQGVQSVELSDWEQLSEVIAHTRGYMQHVEVIKAIDGCATAIKGKKAAISTAHIDGQIPGTTAQTKNTGINSCYPPTSLFVGREEPVRLASEYLLNDAAHRKIFVIHGLGGAGKTQMALRIVEKTQEHWSDVVFVDATSVTTIEATLKDFATRKNIGDTHEDTLRWLASATARWLLLIDNADDPRVDVTRYLPKGSSGRILVTTRNQDLVVLGVGPDSDCNVSSMEHDEALQLLLKATRRENEELAQAEMRTAKQLLEDFGCLPLAITQAGAYIHKHRRTFAQYHELYRKQPEKILQKYSQVLMRLDKYDRTTFDTWMLSYDLLSDLARHLLWMLGYMQQDRITADIFQRAAVNFGGFRPDIPLSESEQAIHDHTKGFLNSFLDSSGDWDDDAFLGVMGEILSYSLIEYNRVNETYMLHPLVQTWARTVAPEALKSMPTAYLLSACLNWDDRSEDHAILRLLHLHVTSVLQHSSYQGMQDTIAACLSRVPYVNGHYHPAFLLQSQVVTVRRQMLGEDHSCTQRAMTNLGLTYSDQGRYKEAEKLQVQVHHANKAAFGEEHPETLIGMKNLANTYSHQGRHKEAEELEVQVLNARKRVLGEEHPDTLIAMNNLAATYSDQGRHKEAEELQVPVLNARKRVLGEEHPDTLSAMNNLAATYSHQGRHKEAEELQVQVLNAMKRVLGEEHPDTLIAMGNLANTHYNQGRWEQAAELGSQVLEAQRRLLGPEHPHTVHAMHSLATMYEALGEGYRTEYEALSKELSQIETSARSRGD